jgi:hypothetical protein
MKRLISTLVVVGLLTALVVRAFSAPVSMRKLQQLRRGMTQDEIRAVLGEPSKIYGSQWTYRRQLVFGFVNIHWQGDGTYDGEFNYERF